MAKGQKPIGDIIAVWRRSEGGTGSAVVGTVWLSENGNATWVQDTVPRIWMEDRKMPHRFYMRLRDGVELGGGGSGDEGGGADFP